MKLTKAQVETLMSALLTAGEEVTHETYRDIMLLYALLQENPVISAKKAPLTLTDKRKRCEGCHDNYYNTAELDGCWSLVRAKPCDLLVYYSTQDVQRTLRKDTLSCWHNFAAGTIVKKKRGK